MPLSLVKKKSPFGRAVMEIFNFFFVELLMGHPIYIHVFVPSLMNAIDN